RTFMSSFTIARTFSAETRANREAWESEYCCSGFNSPRTTFSFSRMSFSSARDTYDSSMVSLLGAPQVLGPDDRLLDPTAEADVINDGGSAMLHDRARHAVEPVVRPPFLYTRIDDARHALAVCDGEQRPRDGGEPALARTAAERLPCRP